MGVGEGLCEVSLSSDMVFRRRDAVFSGSETIGGVGAMVGSYGSVGASRTCVG